MDFLTLGLLVAYVVLVGVGIAFLCLRRYEVTVFLVALSPWISAIFPPNTHEADAEQEAGIGSYIRISLLLLMGGIGLIKFFQFRATGRRKLPFHFILLGIFLLLAVISTSYSIDPRYTFIRSSSFVAVFEFLLGFYSWLKDKQRLDQTLNALFLLIGLGTAVNLIALLILPERVWLEGRFRGVVDHPNTMGSFCMLSYPISVWKYQQCKFLKKWGAALLPVTNLYLHLLTGSRGSLVSAALGMGVWLVVLKQKIKLLLLLGMMSGVALYIVHFKPSEFERAESSDITDLTGRPEFWYGCYQLIMERPLLGYGYGVEGRIWNDPRFNKPQFLLWSGSARSSLHNGYLSIAIGGGLVNFIMWCALLLAPLWRCMILPRSAYKAFVMSILSMCLLLNFVESSLLGSASEAAVFFWIAWVVAGKLPQNREMLQISRQDIV